MAEMEAKHTLDDGDEAVMELRGPKRQRTDERNAAHTAPRSLTSEDQKFWMTVAEPPDINYRRILWIDMKKIESIFDERTAFHFTERVLRYESIDKELECALLSEYLKWAEDKKQAASGLGSENEKVFFQELLEAVRDEKQAVEEDGKLSFDKFRSLGDKRSKAQSDERLRLAMERVRKSHPGLLETLAKTGGSQSLVEMNVGSSDYDTANEVSLSSRSSSIGI